MAAAVLDDELLREVLLRLPTAADLLRAALACRPFLHAARHAHFLRRFRALQPSPRLLLGFLFLVPDDSLSPPFFLSAADAPDDEGWAADYSLSFLPGVGAWPAAAWTLLDCRDGHSLLQNRYSDEIAVADPLSRAYLVLPALDPTAGRAVGYGLVVDDGDDDCDWAFRVVCVARDRGSSATLRAMILSSNELRWDEVGDLTCVADLAASKAMHGANGSLYWRLNHGARMLALGLGDASAAPEEAMEFSVINLPPSFSGLSYDVVENGDGAGVGLIHLLAMRDYRIERWVAAPASGAGALTWRLLDTSLRFYRALESMLFGAGELREQALAIIGVVDGVVFVRQCGALLSIDLETMKLTRLSEEDCSDALIYPYAKPRAWPPSFLKPAAP